MFDRSRERINGFRSDVANVLADARTAATQIQEAGASISRASLLVTAIAVVALGVALYALYTASRDQ